MKKRAILGFVLLLSLACNLTEKAPAAKAGVLDLRKSPLKGMLVLGGEWEIYWKKFYGPEHFRSPTPPVPTGYLVLPGPWSGNSANGVEFTDYGYATIRVNILLPRNYKNRLLLRLNFCNSACYIYANGKLVHKSGKIGTSVQTEIDTYDPELILMPRSALETGKLELILKISNYYHAHGGTFGPLWLGPEKPVRKARELNLALDLLMFGAFWILILFNLSFYFMNPGDRAPLYFALFTVGLSPRILAFGESWLMDLLPGLSGENFDRFAFMPVTLAFCFLSLYLEQLFKRFYPRSLLALNLSCGFSLFLVDLIDPRFYQMYFNMPAVWLMVFGIVNNLSVVAFALWKKSTDALLIIFGLGITLVLTVWDALSFHTVAAVRPLGYVGYIFLIFSQTFVLSRRFLGVYRHVNSLTRRLAARNRRLTELDKLKDEFLANTSHELRTPLQGIIGLTEAILARNYDADPLKRDENLRLIASSGLRLSRLVDDLLDFTRIKNKDLELNIRAVDVRSAALLALEMNRPAAERKGLRLLNDVPEDFAAVRADEDRLLQILLNIVSNAVKFTEIGEVRISVRMVSESEMEIQVQDSGPGISAEAQERIFRPFEQLDGGVQRRKEGVGLGLSITRRLVELHQGFLRVKSRPGQGAVFLITLPVALEKGVPVHEDVGKALEYPEQVTVTPETTEYSGKKPAIFFVDDDPINLRVGSETLTQAGYEVHTYSSGPEALKDLRAGKTPVVAVLDVMMPDMTGYELCQEIRREYTANRLPVLMLTARTRPGDFAAGLNCGANDYLTKPCGRETLIGRVNNLVRLEEANREKQTVEKNVKEQIYRDLHDHLGGRLFDLKTMAGRLEPGENTRPEDLQELRETIGESISNLRLALLENQEVELLDDSYLDGLHHIVQKRYRRSERELEFEYEPSLYEVLDSRRYERLKGLFYAVVLEICTNDLKYGTGVSRWNLREEEEHLILNVCTGTVYETTQNGTGNGTGNIVARVAELGGRTVTRLTADVYEAEIFIPLRADTAVVAPEPGKPSKRIV